MLQVICTMRAWSSVRSSWIWAHAVCQAGSCWRISMSGVQRLLCCGVDRCSSTADATLSANTDLLHAHEVAESKCRGSSCAAHYVCTVAHTHLAIAALSLTRCAFSLSSSTNASPTRLLCPLLLAVL
jgi:hypothetical protein